MNCHLVRARGFAEVGAVTLGIVLSVVPGHAALSQANRIGFYSASQTIPLGNCAAVQVVTENSFLQPTATKEAVTVAISGGAGNIQFFSDSACTAYSAGAVIPTGQKIGTFFIMGSKAGSYTLSIEAPGLAAASQAEVFSAPTPAPCTGAQAEPTTPPAQAAAAGFKTLAFDDEFNSINTISSTDSGTYKWFTYSPSGTSAELTMSDLEVSSGCLTILTDFSGYSDGLATINSASSATGAFQHGYFEARMQFYPAGYSAGAWPAFWSYSLEGLRGRSSFAELDFLEAYPGGTGGATQGKNGVTLLTTVHQWTTVNNSNQSVQQSNDVPTLPANFDYNAFHVYGCLWATNSVTWYVDNLPVMTVATGPGTSFTALEQDHMFLVLGTGQNWKAAYDYVHVWQ